jgi:16S rRNA (guanine527-N7)-methyltransferase
MGVILEIAKPILPGSLFCCFVERLVYYNVMRMQTQNILAAAAAIDVALTDEQAAQIAAYAALLADWNARFNLTAITDEQSVLALHFIDSLTILRALPERSGIALLDVGTGAGFPGLVLKIARPDLRVTVIDSTAKKIAFCQEVIRTLPLKGARALHMRSEEFAHARSERGRYDVVTARAVAALPTLVEYLLPFVAVGGVCIAMKGSVAAEEAAAAANAIQMLGGRLRRIEPVALPGLQDKRALVLIDKIAPTPGRFPRPAGAPRHSPLQ